MSPRLRLVVPCYNEAGRLKPDAFLALTASRADAALLFVDDGSSDGTAAILAEMAARSAGRVSVLTLPHNSGKARAVQRGVLAAFEQPSSLVGYWDADLSTPLTALQEFIDVLDADPRVDIVIGSRVKLLGRRIDRNALRHYSGRVFATAASLALGVDVYDTQCGAKIFRKTETVRQAFEAPFRSKWIGDVEILARYIASVGRAAAESRIYELPLKAWTEVPGSKLNLWQGLRSVWDLALIRRQSAR
jgi:dolichyl-phosphate beta-glucosyltransferase